LLATPAFAQSTPGVYGSIGYSSVQADDIDLGAVTGRIGTRLTPFIGIEGEASIGVNDDEIDGFTPAATVELEHDLAAYVTGTVPVSPNLELFARVGYGTTSIEADVAGFTASEDGESVNYGVGANYFFDGSNGVRGDWTRRDFQDDGGDADVWSLSYVRRF
jgi:hypothetical protein